MGYLGQQIYLDTGEITAIVWFFEMNYSRLFRTVVLACALFLGSGHAAAPNPIPSTIVNNSSLMVIYHWGRIDAIADMEARLANPATDLHSLRTLYLINLTLIPMFRQLGNLMGEAYMIGRSHAYWDAADLAGEP